VWLLVPAVANGFPECMSRDPRRALRSRTRDERGAVLMGVGSWSTGLMRAGRRPVTAGLVVVGIAALSVAALPAPVAGAAPRPATWTQQTPTASPPARYDASMAYDPATEDTVLLGGANGSMLDDTWTRNATVWAEQSPTTSPSARFGASMDYDTATHDVVLFGGGTSSGSAFGDTWTWNGTTWTEQSPTVSLPARYYGSMAYDTATGNLVLFGGDNGSTYFGDTWTYGSP